MLTIQTTGIDDFLHDDGIVNVKTLVFGFPGCGKTRSSSYWPKPFIVSAEGGTSVLADRPTPKVEVRSERDLPELRRWLLNEASKRENSSVGTVIVDTFDGMCDRFRIDFLRRANKTELAAKDGDYDRAFGPIRDFLLFLRDDVPFNVVVNCHLKKVTLQTNGTRKNATAPGEDTVAERQGYDPLLPGKLRDEAAGWFDLVGLMENYWALENGEQVVKRQIRWQPIPEMPYLKDRFYALPSQTPVEFADTDYSQLVDAIKAKSTGMGKSQVVGEIGQPDIAAPPDVPAGPVVAKPEGTVPKSRGRKAAAPPPEQAPTPQTPAPAEEPAAPAEAAPPTHDEAVANAAQALGASVQSDTSFEARVEAATDEAALRALWPEAVRAGAMTPELETKIKVRLAALRDN